MPVVNILLAETIAMVRGALVALIELEPDLKVVVATDRGDAIVPAALEHKPDVAIIDVDLPGLDGLSAAARLHEELPACRTLILFTGPGKAGMLRRALAAHVAGCMHKQAPAEQLATAVRDIAAGRNVIDRGLVISAWDSGPNPLSPREHEILRHAAEGSEPVEIAASLHLSVGTVRNYLTAIVAKLKARNRIEAIRTAHDRGILP